MGEYSDSEEDSEIEMDELLLMALQCYEEQDKTQNGIVDNHNAHCIPKETERNMLKTSILECEKDRKQVATMEIDELLLMVLQKRTEWTERHFTGAKDERKKYDGVEILNTPAHGCVQDRERSRVATIGDGKQESNVS